MRRRAHHPTPQHHFQKKVVLGRRPSLRKQGRDHQPDQYEYNLPARFIAQAPVSPRDHAKLMVVDQNTGEVSVDRFFNLGRFLPTRTVLVLNQTKVVPARLRAKKDSGGMLELLVLEWRGREVTVIANRKLRVGQMVNVHAYQFRVREQHQAEFILQMQFSPTTFPGILRRFGQPPIPPYIKHSKLSRRQLLEKYQSVFARQTGSVAAPTASLHFTRRMLNQLRQAGVAIEFVTLHVGLGTFAPVTEKNLESGKLHREQFEVTPAVAARLNRYKRQGRPIIAVGTTVARTLETASRHSRLTPLRGTTGLFIRPGYRWKFVDGLITNFHVPKSSLMMLVGSLVGRPRLLALYEYAKQKNFRFFSFGDAMLIR